MYQYWYFITFQYWYWLVAEKGIGIGRNYGTCTAVHYYVKHTMLAIGYRKNQKLTLNLNIIQTQLQLILMKLLALESDLHRVTIMQKKNKFSLCIGTVV